MGIFDKWKPIIDFFLKAFTVSVLLLIFTWLLTLFTVINNAPSTGINPVTLQPVSVPFGLTDYLGRVLAPVFMIALIISLLAEKRMSNDYAKHIIQTLAGSAIVALEFTLILAVGNSGFVLSWEGVLLQFWISLISLWFLYLFVRR